MSVTDLLILELSQNIKNIVGNAHFSKNKNKLSLARVLMRLN